MAILLVKNMLTAADYIRTTRRFSSAQSLHRSGKKGITHILKIGRMQFVGQMPDKVAAFHSIVSWEDLNAIEATHLPGGLCSLKSAGKKAKVSPERILTWAAANRINVYWVGGHFSPA